MSRRYTLLPLSYISLLELQGRYHIRRKKGHLKMEMYRGGKCAFGEIAFVENIL